MIVFLADRQGSVLWHNCRPVIWTEIRSDGKHFPGCVNPPNESEFHFVLARAYQLLHRTPRPDGAIRVVDASFWLMALGWEMEQMVWVFVIIDPS